MFWGHLYLELFAAGFDVVLVLEVRNLVKENIGTHFIHIISRQLCYLLPLYKTMLGLLVAHTLVLL